MLRGRCAARGLILGDCCERQSQDSVYCYYHSKVQRGVISTHLAKNSNGAWVEAAPSNVYPVWPLPATGYVLLEDERLAA